MPGSGRVAVAVLGEEGSYPARQVLHHVSLLSAAARCLSMELACRCGAGKRGELLAAAGVSGRRHPISTQQFEQSRAGHSL